MAPVIAQVMMTLSVALMILISSSSFLCADIPNGASLVRGERHEAPVSPFLPFGELVARRLGASRALDLGQPGAPPVHPTLHLGEQIDVDILIALDIVAHAAGRVQIDRLERTHEAPT